MGLSYLPEMVGRHSTVSLGKATGSASIRWKLDELGLSANKEQIIKLVFKVKEIALENGRDVSDEEFVRLVDEMSKS